MAVSTSLEYEGLIQFMVSGACFEHQCVIGLTPERMTQFETALISLCREFTTNLYAWCVLPNHYHLLVQTDRLKVFRAELGKLHGRSSFEWNGEDNRRGRQVWHNCLDRKIKSHGHFWAAVNYIHHNPVRHRYIEKWQDCRGRAQRISLNGLDATGQQEYGASILFLISVRRGILTRKPD